MPYGGTSPEQDKKIESCVSKVMPTLKDKYSDEKVRKSHAIAICKSQIMGTKSYCFTDLEFKSEGEDFYIEGYASSINKDLGNDELTAECLEQMVGIINSKNIKLGFDHTELLGGRPTLEAVGRLIEAKVENGKLWVKGILDKTFSHIEEIKQKIQNKFLDGMSIEYQIDPALTKESFVDGIRHRIIGGLKALAGVALTPRPMNPDSLFDYYVKHFEAKEEHMEKCPECDEEVSKDKMEEHKKKHSKKDKGETMEEKKVEVQESELVELKRLADLGKDVEAQKAKDAKLTEIKSLALAAFKSEMQVEMKKIIEPYINPEEKFGEKPSNFDTELKHWRDTVNNPEIDIEAKYAAAAKLHNKLDAFGITRRMTGDFGFKARYAGKSFEVKGKTMQNISAFEYKALLEHDTNKVSDADYYQSAAELNDIYDPVIVSHLNDKTTLWGLMRKKDVSNTGADRYGFRFWRTRIEGAGGDTSTYNYDENPTLTGYHAKMLKAQIPFMQYGVTVEVSGLTQATARGSVGDIFAEQVKRGSADLLRGINSDLYGTSEGFTDGGKILGLEVIGDDGGTYANLYGHARATYTTLQGTDAAQTGTPNIDKPLLRTMVRVPEKNGAPRDQMIYVCDQIQRDKILGLLDPAQRFNSTSARAGFEGLPTFDGLPIHSDDQCNDGYIYAVPMGPEGYYAAVLVAPTFEDLAKTTDSKKGFIKTYFAVVCEHPNWVYKVTGLATT